MDWKKLLLLAVAICFIPLTTLAIYSNSTNIIEYGSLDNMPIIQSSHIYDGGITPNRDIKYRDCLSASVKIFHENKKTRNENVVGSGTIVYYNYDLNEAWIISCGHLWSGNMTVEEGRTKNLHTNIVTWYHNGIKLPASRTYDAEVVFYNNSGGFDISLLKFKPDWQPNYFPIAPQEYDIAIGDLYHSTGCDKGKEVARYEVEILAVGDIGFDTLTKRNSPRLGRSGGGLLTDDGYLIGICWATTDAETGNGVGYFVSLPSIRQQLEKEGCDWLLNVPIGLAQRILIIDRENPYRNFDHEYIPMPVR